MPPTLIRFTRWLLLESAASASMVPVSTIPGRGSASHSGSRSAASADRKSTRLNSSHSQISYAVFCLKKKKRRETPYRFAGVQTENKQICKAREKLEGLCALLLTHLQIA